jgi:hypothetical protein
MTDPARQVYSIRRFHIVALLLTLVFLPIVIGASLLIYEYMRFSIMVEQRLRGERGSTPARVYARPLVLRPGIVLDTAGLKKVDEITGLPAGRYLVWAAGKIGNNGGDADADCELVSGGSSFYDTNTFRTKGGSYSTGFALNSWTVVSGGGSVEVDCNSSDYVSKNSFAYVDLTAVPVEHFN